MRRKDRHYKEKTGVGRRGFWEHAAAGIDGGVGVPGLLMPHQKPTGKEIAALRRIIESRWEELGQAAVNCAVRLLEGDIDKELVAAAAAQARLIISIFNKAVPDVRTANEGGGGQVLTQLVINGKIDRLIEAGMQVREVEHGGGSQEAEVHAEPLGAVSS